MSLYRTIIKAVSPTDGTMKTYLGPYIEGISVEDAQKYCDENGLGYCKVDEIVVARIPCKEGTLIPDMSKKIDYHNTSMN